MAVADRRFRVMASEARIVVVAGSGGDAEAAAADGHHLLDHLERRWSRFRPDSDLNRAAAAAGGAVPVDPTTRTLVDTMVSAWRATGGRYDPTLGPELTDAGYVDVTGRSALDRPGIGRAAVERAPRPTPSPGPASTPAPTDRTGRPTPAGIVVDDRAGTVTLPVGLALDPGGLGKGLAADMVVEHLRALGADGVLCSIGGDLAAAGRAPTGDGWVVAVEDPSDPTTVIGHLAIDDGGVATSSTRSRRWTVDGEERHHLVDPASGRPSTTDLASVTVVAASGARAESCATALILEGSGGFVAAAEAAGVEAVAVSVAGRLLATGALRSLVPEPTPSAAHTQHAAQPEHSAPREPTTTSTREVPT